MLSTARFVRSLLLSTLLVGPLVASPWEAPAKLGNTPPLREFGLSDILARSQSAPLAARSVVSRPDTLEIYAYLAEFAEEKPDNAATTGRGTFGSDSAKYSLDPVANRQTKTREHFLRQFEYVSQYWRKASQNKLEVVFRVFPEVGTARAYQLPRSMASYSPARTKSENRNQSDSLRSSRHLEMVADAARLAAKDPAGPFATAMPTSGQRHRQFLLIHAGATAFTDGGKDGSSSANTPSDMFDFIARQSDFAYLADTVRTSNTSYRTDAHGVVLNHPNLDTLRTVMVMSETATQDKLNYGQVGNLTSLIGTAIGLPNTYDDVRGYSVMGTYCLMDYAGANAGLGFLPVLPSAWVRLYMGWATPVVAKVGTTSTFNLPPVRLGTDSVLVIPLDDGEYLLAENRQRASSDGLLRVLRGDLLSGDTSTIAVPADSVGLFFSDTICQKNKCEPNARRLKGYVLQANPDVGLPSSGILVWKVNDWLMRQNLRYGTVNFWQGDTLRERYRAITLLEADASPTLGQKFVNAAGQSVFDFGTGADLLPHITRNSKGIRDTVRTIGPDGFANTHTLSGGATQLTLFSDWPTTARPEWTNSFVGDSTWTPGGNVPLSLRVQWGPLRDTLGEFPVRLPPANSEAALLPGPLPGSRWILDAQGRVQLIDAAGKPAFATPDTVALSQAYDSVTTLVPTASSQDTLFLPIQRVGTTLGTPVASALLGDTLVMRTTQGDVHTLRSTTNWTDSVGRTPSVLQNPLPQKWTAGPVISGQRVWLGDAQGNLASSNGIGQILSSRATVAGSVQALCETRQPNGLQIAFVNDSSRVGVYAPGTDSVRLSGKVLEGQVGEVFQIASADFDRDGADDLFVLGSFGRATLLSGRTLLPLNGWPRTFARGAYGVGEAGGIALADVNRDGKPDAIFAGTDRLWVVDHSGLPLSGWPATLSGTDIVGSITASRLFPAGWVGSTPVVVRGSDSALRILVGTPDARIEAFAANGKTISNWNGATWPLAAGGRRSDSLQNPSTWVALQAVGSTTQLQALSGKSSLTSWNLGNTNIVWGQLGQNAQRTNRMSDSVLSLPATAQRTLSNFHLFPSPMRNGSATFRYDLGDNARSATLTVFDQTGAVLLSQKNLPTAAGRRDWQVTGRMWGTGVYAARLEIEWANGGSASSWTRFGVIR